jgi:hypothetical protein
VQRGGPRRSRRASMSGDFAKTPPNVLMLCGDLKGKD